MAQGWCCHCLSVEFRGHAIPAFSPSLRQGLPIHTCLWRLTFLHLHCLLAVRDNRCLSYFILLLCRFWVLQFKSSGSSGKHVYLLNHLTSLVWCSFSTPLSVILKPSWGTLIWDLPTPIGMPVCSSNTTHPKYKAYCRNSLYIQFLFIVKHLNYLY